MRRLGWVASVFGLLLFMAPAAAVAQVTPSHDPAAVAATLDSGSITSASFPVIPPQAQCADGLDNDSDGLVDAADTVGCPDPSDNRELNDRPAACANGLDDDGDGKIDLDDPDCTSLSDDNEADTPDPIAECSNGRDDDGDGKIDFSQTGTPDPGCTSPDDLDEGSEGPPLPASNPAAVAATPLGGFPLAGGTYAIISSGDVEHADDPGAPATTDNGGGPGGHSGPIRDLVTLRVGVAVPAGVNCAQIDFRFYSEEFPEFVGHRYNDGFVAELDVSDFRAEDSGDTVRVVAPHNFAFDSSGQVISVNTVGFSAGAAAGTPYDGASPLLRASTPIDPGNHDIFLSVFDVFDSILDSAAFIDAVRLVNLPPGSCNSGASADRTPPETTIVAGPNGETTDTTPTFEFTASESRVTFQCRMDGGGFATCSSPYTSGPLALGAHTFEVRAIDAAGNVGAPASRTFRVVAPGDRDGDGIPDHLDTSDGSLPPEPGRTVNVRVVSGDVYYRPPAARARRARVAQSTIQPGPRPGFLPLKGAATIPVGSKVDVEEGRVALRSAANLKGATQSAKFYAGIFAVKQRIAKRRMKTDIIARPSRSRYRSVCGTRAKGSVATTSRKRRKRRAVSKLWGRGKGRFRTVGGSSAATVRGTIWLTRDRCDGTLTRVVKGRVSVRDFGRRRNVLVRAGRSYLARATRAQLRRRR